MTFNEFKKQEIGNNSLKRICIYGTGGVGGFFGGLMVYNMKKQKDEFHEIYFIARGEHLRKIQEEGLILKTPENQMVVRPTRAVEHYGQIEAPDLILIGVKGYDLEKALEEISKNMNKNTIILPLLNGVDIYHRIREKISHGIILPACVYVGTHIEKPGVVTQSGGDGKIIFGKDPQNKHYAPDEVIGLFKRFNINYEFRKDSFPAIWEKYIFITSFGLVGAAYNKSLGEIMEDDKFKGLVKEIMGEIVDLAELEEVKLPENIIEISLEKGNNFPYDTTTSYHKDVNRNGKNEGDLFGGAIIRLGEKYGVKTPVTAKLFSKIQIKN